MSDYKDIIANYKEVRGGIIEAFHDLQKQYNYIPSKALKEAAKVFNISESEAYAIASFYAYLSVEEKGKYIIRVCRSTPCHLEGAQKMLECLENYLKIKVGQTTPDGKFTLEWTECVGQCQATPVMTINYEPFTGIKEEIIPEILANYE